MSTYYVTDKGKKLLDKYFDSEKFESKSGSSLNRKARVLSLLEYLNGSNYSTLLDEVSRQRSQEKSGKPSWNVPGSDSDYKKDLISLVKKGYVQESSSSNTNSLEIPERLLEPFWTKSIQEGNN